MNRLLFPFLILLICLQAQGCQTVRPSLNEGETTEDLKRAIGSVAGAISGEQLTEEEVADLTDQIQNDPEAQSAIQSISETYTSDTPSVKYNPETGQRFAPHLTHDPVTGVELLELKD